MISQRAIGTLRQQAEIPKAGRKPVLTMTVRVAFQCGLGVALLGALLVTAAHTAQAQTLTTLYSFTNTFGSNIYGPQAGLAIDGNGNLYGTTLGGGFGAVFELTSAGTLNVLHEFSFTQGKKADGYGAYNRLVQDANGNLFGTTAFGGAYGKGTVFQLAPDGTETLLHSFRGGTQDGNEADTTMVLDGPGNLYGTTVLGGSAHKGTVFKVTPDGTESVIYSFGPKSSGDGQEPFVGGLIMDAKGYLYGATYMGGIYVNCQFPHTNTTGCGTVFRISPTGQETVLYKFRGDSYNDGWGPVGGMVRDAKGNLYGTTYDGGGIGCLDNFGCGTVFKVTPRGKEKVLYRFAGGSDGANPYAGLVADAQGNLYGTTFFGGGSGCDFGVGCGTIFKLTPDGIETVLYRFTGGTDGSFPFAPLVFDGQGNLYGTTSEGGVGNGGTVFELTP
jgi:uncharacterized repeat protein (TIGR03803 family)